MGNKWILRAVCLLAGCLTRIYTAENEVKGQNEMPNNKTTQDNRDVGMAIRHESFEIGSNVTLTCIKHIAWEHLIYVIWNISLQGKECFISMSPNDRNYTTCNDGKRILRMANGDYSLYIPNFSIKDEGGYICDVSTRGTAEMQKIYVTAWEYPEVSGWLERDENGLIVAVCVVKGGKPPASVHVEIPDNPPLRISPSVTNKNGNTVTSRFNLPVNISSKSFTCVAHVGHDNTSHTISRSDLQFRDLQSIHWSFILLGVFAACIIVTLFTVLYLMRGKLTDLSMFKEFCCKSKTPAPVEEKLPQPRDLEEVEPYASYVQRVNSIYNSSAELFNA